jgi:hypothetical protein
MINRFNPIYTRYHYTMNPDGIVGHSTNAMIEINSTK